MRASTRLIELKKSAKRKGWLRWLRSGEGEEADERALLNGCWFVPHRADHVCDWIEDHCCLTEGAWRGKPFRLTDWQRDYVSRLFGWVRESQEWGLIVRRFRWAYLELPKKNGKSPFLGSIGCYLLYADGNQSARIFSTATSKKQAGIVHSYACAVVKASPKLAAISKIRKCDGYNVIEYPATNGAWSIQAADAKTADGVNGHCLADELHRWTDWEFWTTLKWMLAALPEGLFASITTAGADSQSICATLHEKTKAINAGRQQDDQFLGKIYGAEREDDPHKEATWLKANPSLGKTRAHVLKLSDFRADYRTALQDPTQWPSWLRLRLGVWQSAEDAWVETLGGITRWDAGATARENARKRIDCAAEFDWAEIRQWPCWFGLDGATHHDTTAAVFVWQNPDVPDVFWIFPHYWLPEAEAHRLGAKVPYQHWSEQRLITLTPGDACDYSIVKRDLLAAAKGLNLQGFAFDPLFQAEWLTQQLSEELGVPRHEFRPTITQFSPPMKTFGRMIAEKKIRHNGHQIFTWQLGHMKSWSDGNQNVRPSKQKLGDHRTIDGPVALIMAVALATAVEPKPTYYDENEVEFL